DLKGDPGPKAEPEEEPPKPRRVVVEREVRTRPARTGSGPSIDASLVQFLFWLVAILRVAALVVAPVLNLQKWARNRPKKEATKQPDAPAAPELEAVLTHPDEQSAAALWGEADDLARRGKFLEALRTLYLAVLVLLHRANLIRYERTRTNGEYATQLR